MVKLKCQRCGKIWNYTGKNPYVASCTYCRTSVSINKNKIKEQQISDPPTVSDEDLEDIENL